MPSYVKVFEFKDEGKERVCNETDLVLDGKNF